MTDCLHSEGTAQDYGRRIFTPFLFDIQHVEPASPFSPYDSDEYIVLDWLLCVMSLRQDVLICD